MRVFAKLQSNHKNSFKYMHVGLLFADEGLFANHFRYFVFTRN